MAVSLTGLTSYWKMDETGGNRADSHTGGNTLTDNNTVPAGTGKINNAAAMSAANSEYFTKADDASIGAGDIDWTFNFWIWWNATPPSSGAVVALAKDDGTGQNGDYQFFWDGGANTWRWYVFGGAGRAVIGQVHPAAVGNSMATWYMFTLDHRASDNTVGWRINGGARTSAGTTGPAGRSSQPFRLNGQAGFPGNSYGYLWYDEVSFWKRSLTDAEVTQLYNGGAGYAYPLGNLSGSITWAGASAFAVSGTVVLAQTAAWSASSAFAVTPTVIVPGQVAWVAGSTFAVTPTLVFRGQVAWAGTSAWSVTATVFAGAGILWSATSAWEVSPTLYVSGTVAWTASSAFTVSGAVQLPGAVAWTGTSALAVIPTQTSASAIAWSATSTFAVTAVVNLSGTVAWTATSTFLVVGRVAVVWAATSTFAVTPRTNLPVMTIAWAGTSYFSVVVEFRGPPRPPVQVGIRLPDWGQEYIRREMAQDRLRAMAGRSASPVRPAVPVASHDFGQEILRRQMEE